jgi:hypothetical protein
MLLSVFGILNIGRGANNPPPVPYIDINQLKYLFYYEPNTNMLPEINAAVKLVENFKDKVNLKSLAKVKEMLEIFSDTTPEIAKPYIIKFKNIRDELNAVEKKLIQIKEDIIKLNRAQTPNTGKGFGSNTSVTRERFLNKAEKQSLTNLTKEKETTEQKITELNAQFVKYSDEKDAILKQYNIDPATIAFSYNVLNKNKTKYLEPIEKFIEEIDQVNAASAIGAIESTQKMAYGSKYTCSPRTSDYNHVDRSDLVTFAKNGNYRQLYYGDQVEMPDYKLLA